MSNILFDEQYDYLFDESNTYRVDIIDFDTGNEQRRLVNNAEDKIYTVRFSLVDRFKEARLKKFYADRHGTYDNFYFLLHVYNDRLYFTSGSDIVGVTNGTQTAFTIPEGDLYAPLNDSSYIDIKLVDETTGEIQAVSSSAYSVTDGGATVTFSSPPVSGKYLFAVYKSKKVARFNSALKRIGTFQNKCDINFQIKLLPNETIS